MRFLVSGIGGPAGKSLYQQLTALGHTVIGCDLVPPEGFLAAPRADSPALIPYLQDTIAAYEIDAFIPTVQDELLVVAIAKDLLDTQLLISDAGPIGIAADKWLTADYLQRQHVAVPRTYRLDDQPCAFPVVVKPRVSRGGRGVEVIESAEQFAQITDPALLIQEFAPGEEFCPQLFISPSTGEIEVVVLHKTALKEGRVGNASSVERVHEPVVEVLARNVARTMQLQGPVDMDIRYTQDSEPVLLEVNARFGANSAHAPEMLQAYLAEVS